MALATLAGGCFWCLEAVFQQLLQTYAVEAVYTNRDYEPYATKRDESIQRLLQSNAIAFHTFKDHVIFEKDEVVKNDGSGYLMYSPYAKKWRSLLRKEHVTQFSSE